MTYVITSKEPTILTDVLGNKFIMKEWSASADSIDLKNARAGEASGALSVRWCADPSFLTFRPSIKVAEGVYVQTHDLAGNEIDINWKDYV